ncbi:hypothetical protein C0638_01195 [Paenibacillus sp. lzh-N1]|uniref:hypothetical protein n=1 Tax=Paenibacillus sp. lzh-N1 TaxID=2069255 RepID=UPI000C802044|nr:hypothetical protein [Paenibacillus sp. lzh-N1]AUO05282.1 hypothetical protein C0638_01195 [Paenibacillus sp. lzh-N1]
MNESKQDKGRGRPRILSEKQIERWISKYGEDIQIVDYKKRGIKYSLIARESGLISEDEEFAYFLLYGSVNSRINNTKHGDEYYRRIPCEWTIPEETVEQIIKCKPEMWLEWKRLTDIYLEKGKPRGLRPSIDRTDETEGYTFSNIAAMSQHDNTQRATAQPHFLIKMYDSKNPESSRTFRKYDTKREALKAIGLSQTESDSGKYYEADGCVYLLQSSALTHGEKELIQKEEDDNKEKTYRGSILIATIELGDGRTATISKEFTYTQSAVIIKETPVE